MAFPFSDHPSSSAPSTSSSTPPPTTTTPSNNSNYSSSAFAPLPSNPHHLFDFRSFASYNQPYFPRGRVQVPPSPIPSTYDFPTAHLQSMMSGYPAPSSAYPQHHQNQPLQPAASGVKHEMNAPPVPMAQQSYQYDGLSPSQPSNQYTAPQASMQAEGAQHGGPATATEGEGAQKSNRLRKACDACSTRKVKCDEYGPPCKPCAQLDIPCTFERPSRRRGPPNRHAEAIKKRRLESPSATGSPVSPSEAIAALTSLSSHAVLSAEAICPFPILELLVDDFFTYIHPLTPFPHEPSFRAAFRERHDQSNPSFLALLASMVCILVASFPRKPRLHLKAQHREDLFPSSISLVRRCHKVAVEARGAGYLDKELTIYDAATSYFLGLCGAYTFNWRQCRLYFGETLTIARVLGAHKSKDPGVLSVGSLPQYYGGTNDAIYPQIEPMDFIKQQISRRIFWVMFVRIRSMQQLGASFGELIMPPPTLSEPYPPLPVEVDDEYIYVDHIDPQPPGVISKIAGFNLGVQIYQTYTPLANMELAHGIDEVVDFNKQKRLLSECLRKAKHALDNAPPELMLQPGSQPGEFASPPERKFYPSAEYPGRTNGHDAFKPLQTPDARRKLQYEIQKANIYASQLGTRSYIVEKYWNLQDAYHYHKATTGESPKLGSPGMMATGLDGMLSKGPTNAFDSVEEIVVDERENIVKDLLRVLSSINQVNMEPNGGSFINKIRSIASTLIDTPENRKGSLALKAQEYLGRFLDMLMKLERVSPARGGRGEIGDPFEEDEEALRHWADLREYQTRFAQAGGLLAEF